MMDVPVNSNDFEMLNAVASAKSATLRLRGQNGIDDFDIDETDRAIIQDVLEAYKKLGGTPP